MDVTCERCGTEYEFDETLVSDRGTTVKCTNCGHLFKVFRPGSGPGSALEARAWQVRKRGSGAIETLSSLRELQQRITRGELREDDEISRSGEAWKRLGDIAELATFFQAARAAKNEAPATRTPKKTPVGLGAPAVPTSPPGGPAKQTLMGHGAAPPPGLSDLATNPASRAPPRRSAPPFAPPPRRPNVDPPRAAPPAPRPRTDATPLPPRAPYVTTSRLDPPTAEPQRAPRVSAHRLDLPADDPPRAPHITDGSEAPPADGPARVPHLDDDEPAAPIHRGGRAGLWIALVVCVAIGGGLAYGWDAIAQRLGLSSGDRVQEFLANGDHAMQSDHEAGYDRAVREYTKASAIADRDLRVLVSLARAHAAWAQSLFFEAADLEARAAADPALRGQAEALRRDARRHAGDARQQAEDAVRLVEDDLTATVAVADALRLSGDLARARQHLDRARSLAEESPAELHLAAALLAADEASGDMTRAREEAARAVEKDPALLRARLALARALLAGNDARAARAQIDAVLAAVDDHPAAVALRRAIDQGLPPAVPLAGDGGTADAGPPDAGPATEPVPPVPPVAPTPPTPTPPTPPTATPTPPVAGGEPPGAGAPPGRDYDWYVRRAEQLLDSGQVGRAEEHFEAALGVRPGAAEAMTGLGYVKLNRGDAAGAVRYFQPAARAGYGDALIGLGDAYRRLGRLREALRAYESYLERRPNGPHAAMAQRQVEMLRGQVGDEPETPPGETPPGEAPPEPPPSDTPPTPPGELPAPRGTDPESPPPSSDTPAVGMER